MDFRMRNLKENKGNYNSMVQFPRNNESLPHYEQQQQGKLRQIEGRLNALSESHRAEAQNNSSVFYRFDQRIAMLESKMGGLSQGSMMYNKHDCEYQHENLRSAVAAIEARMQDQLEMRLRGLGNTKQDIGLGLQSLKEELGRENRAEKEVFSRFVRQIKESFATLKEALAKDREYVKEAIFQVQNGQQNIANSKSMIILENSRAVEGLAAVTTERQEKLEKKMATMRDDWNSFKLITNQKLEDYKTLIVNVQASALESLERVKARESGADMDKMKEELSEWKQLTEQKNLNVFRQISNAMKIMRMEWRKEHDELGKQIEETTKSVKQTRQSLTKRFEKDLREVGQTITDHFDVFTAELEQVNDLIALSKKEVQEKFSNGMNEIKSNISIRQAQLMQLAHESQQKVSDIEAALKTTAGELKSEIASLEKKTANDIQQLVQSITADNSQWQKQLSKTIKEVKQTFAKDIQTAASTLEKQSAESNKKLQASIETLKKSIETGLSTERSETSKQVSKVTSEITALITDWSGKLKKERETGETSLKDAIAQAKKEVTDIKQALEGEKTKATQRATEDGKKFADLKTSVDQNIAKIGKQSEEQTAKMNKKIDTLKTEIQAKIKMSSDKLLQQVGSKKDADAKAKEDQAKARGTELDKKISDANAKLKAQLVLQITKVSKNVAEDSQKTAKKVESLATSYKKDLQAQAEKQKKFCVDEITKAKAEIEIKMKARDEKLASEVSAKKDAEAKQKEDESKTKITQLEKKINESSTKVKTEMMAQVTKLKTAQAEEISKIKSEMEAKFKAGEQQKAKKEAQAKLKEKQNELKTKSAQLDTKIQIAKKDIHKSTADEITKLTAQFQAKLKASSQASSKTALQDKAKREQLQKKLGEVKQQVEKRIAELKGISMVNLKAQQQESNRIVDQKLQNLRQELTKSITSTTAPFKETTQHLEKLFAVSQQTRESLAESVRKVQTSLFSQRQKNKSIYEKMCSDILDLADSITVVISQLKPAQR